MQYPLSPSPPASAISGYFRSENPIPSRLDPIPLQAFGQNHLFRISGLWKQHPEQPWRSPCLPPSHHPCETIASQQTRQTIIQTLDHRVNGQSTHGRAASAVKLAAGESLRFAPTGLALIHSHRRKKKCAGIDTIFKTCLGCRKNGLLCLPWGSEHPQYPANGSAPDARAGSGRRLSEDFQRGSEAADGGGHASGEPCHVRGHQSAFSDPLGFSSNPTGEATSVPFSVPTGSSGVPLFHAAEPDHNPEIPYAGLDMPMSPNTQAIWMALIQYTEPAQYPSTEEQAIRRNDGGRGRGHDVALDPGYGMLGTGISLSTTPLVSSPSGPRTGLMMKYAFTVRRRDSDNELRYVPP